MLVLAALQTLPRDCYEAARVDGIRPVPLFFRVTLPLIRPALVVAVIFRLLDSMRMFDLAYVLTGTNEATMTLSVHAREQLVSFQDVGYGSAASTALFVMIVIVTALYVAALKPLGRER
jgi:trehalose/maltose transport system permease protein